MRVCCEHPLALFWTESLNFFVAGLEGHERLRISVVHCGNDTINDMGHHDEQ